MSRPRTAWSLIAAACLGGAPAAAQDAPVAVRAGWVVVAPDREPVRNATVLIQGGKIRAVGAEVSLPAGTEVVDAPDAWAVAGFVDASSALSLIGEVDEVADAFEPDVSTRHGVTPGHRDLAYARAAGVTTALLTPGDKDLLGGEATLIKTTGATWRLTSGPPLKLALGPEVLLPGRSPTSRVGAVDAIRRRLAEPEPTGNDAWSSLRRGERVALWRAGSALDARTVLDLAEQHGLALLLQLAPTIEALDARELPVKGRPVILGPYGHGATPALLRLPATIAARGGLPVFASGAPDSPAAGLRLTACLAIQNGLDPATALDALTRAPATALGIADRVGTLEPGKDADLVLLDGPPLDLRSRVLTVFVDGRPAFARPPEERP